MTLKNNNYKKSQGKLMIQIKNLNKIKIRFNRIKLFLNKV
jgi:hypothetical protein